ncbi:MAG: XrtA/PEP-CTERM system TPR-repeat protein PrsT [Colwellia sp.]
MYIRRTPKLVASVLILTSIIAGCSKKTSVEYIDEARELLESGKNSAAIISLKNALKNENNNIEARFLLGSIYEQEGQWLNAKKELEIAYEAGANKNEALLLLTKVHYRLDDVDYLVPLDGHKDYGDLANLYRAIIALKEGDITKSKALLDEVILVNNHKEVSELALAWDYFLNRDYTNSLLTLEKLTDFNYIKDDLIELKIANLVSQNKHADAAEELETFLSLHRQSHIHRLQLAEQYTKARNYTKAEENADLLLTLFKNNVLLNRIKAEIKFNEQNYTLAKEYADIALRNSQDVLSKVIAGVSSYKLEQYESSYNYLSSVKNHFPDDHLVKQILNLLSSQLSLGKTDDELLSENIRDLISRGEYDEMRIAISEASPESAEGVIDLRLGLLKAIEGDTSYANDFQRAIASGYAGIEPSILLAQKYMEEKAYDKVLEIADSLEHQHKSTAMLLQGSVLIEKGEYKKAINIYDSILLDEPNNTGAMFKLSEIYSITENYAKSIDYLKKIYAFSSSNIHAVQRLFKLSLSNDFRADVERFFISQAQADEKNVNRHIVVAEFYVLQGDLEKALVIASRYLLKHPKQLEMSLLKVRVLLSLGRVYDANNIIEVLDNKYSNQIEVVKSKAYILNINGKRSEAINLLEDFFNLNSNNINDDFSLMLASLYFENRDFAKTNMALVKVINKTHPKYLRVSGKLALLNRDNLRAMDFLSQAYDSQPSSVLALELAQAMQNMNKYDKAITLLERALSNADSNELIMLKYKLAELYEERNPEKAELYYNQLLNDTNESAGALNNIAWFYYTQQRFNEGKIHAISALEKAPNVAPINNTLGAILLALNEFSKANEYFRRSVEIEPNNANYKVWLMKGLMLQGEKEAAQKLRDTIDVESLNTDTKKLFKEIFN